MAKKTTEIAGSTHTFTRRDLTPQEQTDAAKNYFTGVDKWSPDNLSPNDWVQAQAITNAYTPQFHAALQKKDPVTFASYKKNVLGIDNSLKRDSAARAFGIANPGFFVSANDVLTDPTELKRFTTAANIINTKYNRQVQGTKTGTDDSPFAYGSRFGASSNPTTLTQAPVGGTVNAPTVNLNVVYDPATGKYTKKFSSGYLDESKDAGQLPPSNTTHYQQSSFTGGPDTRAKLGTAQDALQENLRKQKEAATKVLPPTPASSLGLPKAEMGVDNTTNKWDNSKTAGVASAVGQVGGAAFDTFDKQNNGKTSVGGAALKGAASGAAMGATVGGPWGAAIGGVVGGAAGAISSSMGNSKIDKEIAVNNMKKSQVEMMSHLQPLKNTQSSMYANGTAVAPQDKLAEVEKDELVLRKDVQGKFVKVADFSGGKSHEQGGEPYVVSKGDIIFPGHKRDLINSYLKNDNHSAIDSERQKLPKELPLERKLYKGVNGEELFSNNKYDFGRTNIDEEAKKVAGLSLTKTKTDVAPSMIGGAQISKGGKTLYGDSASGVISQTPISSGITKDNKLESNNWWNATDYAQPISNTIKSFQTPEKTNRRFVNPEEYQYKDQSAISRRDNNLQENVDITNASRFSGGSAQVARAGKTVAGTNKVLRGENINAQETNKADQIASANMGLRNQAKQQNLELANRYDDQDLQNKAILQAYGDRGMADLSNVAAQQRRDSGLNKSQDILLKSLATSNFEFTGSDGVIYKQAPDGTYINSKTAVPKPDNVSVTQKK